MALHGGDAVTTASRPLHVGITTFGFLYRVGIEDALHLISGAGYRNVEIAHAPPHVFAPEMSEHDIGTLRRLLDSLDLRCVSVNPVELNLISPNPALRRAAADQYRHAIRLAHGLGSDLVVVIPGRQSQLIPMPPDMAAALAYEQLTSLVPVAAEFGVKLAVETVPFGFGETSLQVLAVIERLDRAVVGIALDVANIFGKEDVPAAIERSAPRLLIAHLSDSWKHRWAHTSIGRGEIDLGQFVASLKGCGFRGPCVYELVDGEDPAPRLAPDLRRLESFGLVA